MGNCCCCGEADAGRKGSIRADGTYVTIPGKSTPDKAAVPGSRSCSSPSHKSAAGLEGEQSLAPCFSVLSGASSLCVQLLIGCAIRPVALFKRDEALGYGLSGYRR